MIKFKTEFEVSQRLFANIKGIQRAIVTFCSLPCQLVESPVKNANN